MVAITLPPATIGIVVKVTHAGNQILPWHSYGLLAAFLAASAIFAMACWTTRRPRARRSAWAIAGSAVLLLSGLVFLRQASHFAAPQWVLIAVGMVGLFVFSRPETVPYHSTVAVKRPRMPGDRTNPWLDRAVTLLFCAAAYASSRIWAGWSETQGLASNSALASIGLILLAVLATSMLHELGHATAAWSFNMKLLSFNAGPFQWRKREGRWRFKFEPSGLVNLGGAVSVVPTNRQQPRWQDVCMIAAGPAASICFGLIALRATLSVRGTAHEPAWEFLAHLASFCLIAAVLNLLPFRAERGAYSDGARILQLLTGSPVASLHRALSSVQSTLVTARRMRDLDAEAMEQTAATFGQHLGGLQLRLYAAQSYDDSGRLTQARAALATAEAAFGEFSTDLSASLHTVFIYGHAYLNRDAVAARLWWERMEQKKPDDRNIHYWLARTALLWIEGRLEEAEQTWLKAYAQARQLPQFGAFEYDRHRCTLLRQELDLVSPASPVQEIVTQPRLSPRPASMPYPIFGVNPVVAAD
jgi:Zn-dependent protease